jgi:ABC-2 type transport system ATP-binding protein
MRGPFFVSPASIHHYLSFTASNPPLTDPANGITATLLSLPRELPTFASMNTSTDQPVLQVENLDIFYGNFPAVRNVSFEVQPGEIFGLLGPNGAGKTSTLSAAEGLIKATSGTIRVAGYDIRRQPLYARACMGVQLQATSFQPELTVGEIIRLYAGLYGVPLTIDQIRPILADIKLADQIDKRFGQLSGGQQQRVSLVIATIHNPPLVLMDEPTTGLDPQSRRQLWVRIEAMRDKGHGILLTTHSMEEAEAVCDRIAIIDHGRIIATDAPQAIIDKNRERPEVIAASRRGKITLEDVFIGLTGDEVRA